MGGATEGGLNVTLRGYDGAMQRVSEIMARARAIGLKSHEPEPSPSPSPLSGQIGNFRPMDPFSQRMSVAPDQIRSLIQGAASKAGIDPLLFEALVSNESSFNPEARSSKGAMGLTQLMPGTARALGVSDPFDPAQNLDGGARYLSQLLRQYNGDERLALAAYNAGPGAVDRAGGVPVFSETQAYVRRVLAQRDALRGGQ